MIKEAFFYEKLPDKSVKCFLCRHNCIIKNASSGFCGVRRNTQGILYSLNYADVMAANPDPIEKKPLFHFLPGSTSYSIACCGCNFNCDFCQNWQISQYSQVLALGIKSSGERAADKVIAGALRSGCPSISYTYTEPTIYFEYAYDCAKLAKDKGIKNVFVTNGYMSASALKYIAPYLDAANVDLKSFREDFYRKFCKASLKPVLENIETMKRMNIWVEITTLIVPGHNDSREELSDIASFIASLDKNIPWHISKFYPNYKMNDLVPHAGADIFQEGIKIGREKGLKYVYAGNVYLKNGEDTYCPVCSKLLIARQGFFVKQNFIKKGKCGFCGAQIQGVWD